MVSIPVRPHPVVAGLLLMALCLLAPSAWGAKQQPDEDADEQEMSELKQALLEDQRTRAQEAERLHDRAGQRAVPAQAGVSRLWDLLPEGGALLDWTAWYRDPAASLGSSLRIELSLSKTIDPYLRLDAHALIGTQGFSLLEAYASTLGLPWRLKLRAGYLLHRFGIQNRWHPHSLTLVERPMVLSRVFGADGGGGLGLEASLLLPVPWYALLAAAVLDASGAERARSFFGAAPPARLSSPLDLLYVLTLKQFLLLRRSIRFQLGLSVALGPNSSGRHNRTDVYGADLLLCYQPPHPSRLLSGLCLLSEWLLRRRQVPEDVLQDLSGYTELRIGLTAPLTLLLRHEYGSSVALDPLDPTWDADRHRAAAGLSYQLTPRSALRLAAHVDILGDRLSSYAILASLLLRLGQHGAPHLSGPFDLDN